MANNGQKEDNEFFEKMICAVVKGELWEIRHRKKWELKYNKRHKSIECPYCKKAIKKYNKVFKYWVCKSCEKLFLKEIHFLTEVEVSKIELWKN